MSCSGIGISVWSKLRVHVRPQQPVPGARVPAAPDTHEHVGDAANACLIDLDGFSGIARARADAVEVDVDVEVRRHEQRAVPILVDVQRLRKAGRPAVVARAETHAERRRGR